MKNMFHRKYIITIVIITIMYYVLCIIISSSSGSSSSSIIISVIISSIIIILYQLQVGNYCLSSRQEVINWFDYYLWHSFLYRDMLKKQD